MEIAPQHCSSVVCLSDSKWSIFAATGDRFLAINSWPPLTVSLSEVISRSQSGQSLAARDTAVQCLTPKPFSASHLACSERLVGAEELAGLI
jgi:hypothetical protein